MRVVRNLKRGCDAGRESDVSNEWFTTGWGKSSVIAAALRRFLEDLRADPAVQWDGNPSQLGEGVSATSFTRDGTKHALLLQHIGSDNTVTTEAELLEYAMIFTKKVFHLRFNIPWDQDELINMVPNWLEQVPVQALRTQTAR